MQTICIVVDVGGCSCALSMLTCAHRIRPPIHHFAILSSTRSTTLELLHTVYLHFASERSSFHRKVLKLSGRFQMKNNRHASIEWFMHFSKNISRLPAGIPAKHTNPQTPERECTRIKIDPFFTFWWCFFFSLASSLLSFDFAHNMCTVSNFAICYYNSCRTVAGCHCPGNRPSHHQTLPPMPLTCRVIEYFWPINSFHSLNKKMLSGLYAIVGFWSQQRAASANESVSRSVYACSCIKTFLGKVSIRKFNLKKIFGR